MIAQLPSGRVTFAFTDVVGSTRSFDEFGDVYVAAVRDLHALIAKTVTEHGGAVVSTEGDGAFLAFSTADEALAALCAIQEQVEAAASDAPNSGALALRMRAGAHTGHATPLGGEYVSLAVHIAARVAASANAGQVIVSQAVQHDLDKPRGVELGRYRLKDIAEPLTLWRVAGPDTPLRADQERVTNVAQPRTSFIGRASELVTLSRLAGEPGIITLTGPGGLGKTRLAAELCLQICDELAGGAWLAELASLDAPDALPGAVAAALGTETASSVDALVRELNRRGDALLVLDNCEHVVDEVAELAVALTERCPRLRLLCTSREPLEVDGEQVLRLQPLGRGNDSDSPGEAEQLFLERATAAGIPVSPDQLEAVSRACEQLDGLPLALELAAARLTTVPVQELAHALETSQIRLQRRGGPRHHRSLTDLVAWSARLLQPGERIALQTLSVFPGRFDAATAKEVLAAVPGATPYALPELTRRSLVDLDGDRYRLLTTIRSYAADGLAADPETYAAAHRALYDWAVRGCPDHYSLFSMSDDFDTALAVLAAMNWGLANGTPGADLLMRRLRYWSDKTGGSEAIRQAATRVLERPLQMRADDVLLHSIALGISAGLGWRLSEGSVDVAAVEALVGAARSVDDLTALYQAVGVAATTLSKVGLDDRAIEYALETLEMTRREPKLSAFRGVAVGDLAVTYFAAGDTANAEKYIREAIDIAEQINDLPNVAVNRCNLAELLLDRGDFTPAIQNARAVLQSPSYPPSTRAIALGLLAEAEYAAGDAEAARAIAPEAAAELRRMVERDVSLASYVDRLRGVLDAVGLP